nr:hypothetical protein [Tanacetum cinerariifolium]
MLPIDLTNIDIRNFDAYKEYYAVATGATPPEPKASVRKTRSSSDTTVTPPTAAAGPRLSTSLKGKQPATTSKAKRIESIFETTSQMDVPTPTSVAPLPVPAPTLTPSTIATITATQQVPTLLTIAPSTLL